MASELNYDGGLTLSMQVKDRKASAAWYQSVMGLKLLYDAAEIGWCELATEIGGVNIGLSEVEAPKVGAGPVPTFGVKDITAARARMEKQGVRFDGPTQTIPGLVMLATFFDPDGNAFMLNQSLMQA